MTKVGDRAGPGTGGLVGTPRGRALSLGLLGKLNTWPSTVPPVNPSLMKEQDEARGRRESQARARRAHKIHDFRESPAEARKACKEKVFAHTKRSLEKLVKHLPLPAKEKEYYGLREGKQRLESL